MAVSMEKSEKSPNSDPAKKSGSDRIRIRDSGCVLPLLRNLLLIFIYFLFRTVLEEIGILPIQS